MNVWIWRIVALSLIIGGSIGIVSCTVNMSPLRALVSGMAVLLLGLLIVLFEKNKRYFAFFITAVFVGIKFIAEVLLYPTVELYVWIDLLGIIVLLSIGLVLYKRKNFKSPI
jgi:hypothetical protein